MAYYVLDDNNNKIEGASLEEVMNILNQAIADGTLENIVKDSAFVTKLKCCVGGDTHQIAFVTQAKYNELASSGGLLENAYYYIIDDTTCEDINKALELLNDAVKDLETRVAALESVEKLTYSVTENKNLLIIPNANEPLEAYVEISGQSTVEAKPFVIYAPCLLKVNITNKVGTTNGISAALYLGGVIGTEIAGYGQIGECIAAVQTTSDVALTPRVRFTGTTFKVLEL